MQEIYLKGQYICKEGELGSCMYIIKDGEVECLKGDKIIRILKKGDNFGQKAILEKEGIRSLDVRAKTDCKIYSISIEFFKNQFGDNFREQLNFNFISTAFMNSSVFSNVNAKMISKTFKFFNFRSLKNNEFIRAATLIKKDIIYRGLLTITSTGKGKITKIEDFNETSRAIKGSQVMALKDETIATIYAVPENQEKIYITANNKAVLLSIDSIPIQNRVTSGVRIIDARGIESGIEIM